MRLHGRQEPLQAAVRNCGLGFFDRLAQTRQLALRGAGVVRVEGGEVAGGGHACRLEGLL